MHRALLVLVLIATAARAAPPEPTGAHPRMLLDSELRTAWQTMAKEKRGPVQGAVVLCKRASDGDFEGAGYQGWDWARVMQACLVAATATGDAAHTKTAIRFFTALLDDLDRVGDHQGGDTAARRDSGYAIRNLGPWTALAYDWLYDQLSPDLRAKARQRWAAWLAWHKDNGYRARDAGSNYQAGYLTAATLIAIAQGGEAGAAGTQLWRFVADELWGKDMANGLAPGGVLDGGDWPEGWQYGPLAVASYSLAARVAKRAGIEVKGVDTWLASVLRRHVYGLSPTDRVYPGGDMEAEEPYMDVAVLTLDAIAFGDAAPDVKRWARGELARLKLVDNETLLFDALAAVGDKPVLVPRQDWPTWYFAAGTGTLYARTRWDDKAVWFVAECQRTLPEHHGPKSGNFVLSRGKDNVIVDPSPYGSLSTLTSNAPTVRSDQLPFDYQPSQAFWGQRSAWDWATQTTSGVVAARCDYSDQYTFQEKKSDIDEALRDFVMLPSSDGTDAVLVVVDRAATHGAEWPMYLRFRVPAPFELAGDGATATIGGTQLAITNLLRTGGSPLRVSSTIKDCFGEGVKRGKCDAARFPVTDFRLTVPGGKPRAAHAISATGAPRPTLAKLGDKGWSGVQITGVRDAVVVWPNEPHGTFTYRARRGAAVTHVVLDAPETAGKTSITAVADGEQCKVTVGAGAALSARPAIVTLDGSCQVAVDPEAASAAPALGTRPAPIRKQETPRRSGCCAAQATPGSPIAMALVVALFLVRRRRRA